MRACIGEMKGCVGEEERVGGREGKEGTAHLARERCRTGGVKDGKTGRMGETTVREIWMMREC